MSIRNNKVVRRNTSSRSVTTMRRDGMERILQQGLKELLEAQKAQEIRFMPEVPDVPRIRFRDNRLYNVELSYNGTFNTATTGITLGALTFQLNQSTLSSNYVGIFDQYRIIQVNVKIFPQQNATLAPNPGNGTPIYTVFDYDDGNTPTNLNTFLNYDTLQITPGGQIVERTLSPHIATAAYSGTFTSYANMPSNQWIDCASPGVVYFGLKYGTDATLAVERFNYVVTMMVQFRSQRSA